MPAGFKQIQNTAALKRVPTVRLNNGTHDLSATLRSHLAPALLEFLTGHRKEAVTLANGGPVQTVGLIQQNFMIQWRPLSAMGRAVEHLHKVLPSGPGRVGR